MLRVTCYVLRVTCDEYEVYRVDLRTSTGTSLSLSARRQKGGQLSPNQLMDNFSSIATTKVTCDGDADDGSLPKSAAAAADRGRELAVGAPGSEPENLRKYYGECDTLLRGGKRGHCGCDWQD